MNKATQEVDGIMDGLERVLALHAHIKELENALLYEQGKCAAKNATINELKRIIKKLKKEEV
jgi:hypothetical protein